MLSFRQFPKKVIEAVQKVFEPKREKIHSQCNGNWARFSNKDFICHVFVRGNSLEPPYFHNSHDLILNPNNSAACDNKACQKEKRETR